MKGKYSRDNQSSQMLDLLYETRVYDLGDSFWCDIIRDNFIKTMMTTNDRNLSSNLKKYKKIIVKTIENARAGRLFVKNQLQIGIFRSIIKNGKDCVFAKRAGRSFKKIFCRKKEVRTWTRYLVDRVIIKTE